MVYTQSNPKQIRVIVIGAHPDDCDIRAGGTAALFVAMGHAVKFVAVTNGDAGHQLQGGGALAKLRTAEAQEAGKRLGVVYDVLDNHDGELLPTLEVRLQIIRKIREWNADVVMTHRPNDYHPDHRYTGMLVQDAAYMVAVPNIAPDVPALKKNPVFLYMQDDFRRPNPFRPDIAIDINEMYSKKIHALDAHQSQVYEWIPWIGTPGFLRDTMDQALEKAEKNTEVKNSQKTSEDPFQKNGVSEITGNYADKVPSKLEDREIWLAQKWALKITSEVRTALEKWYGKEKAVQAEHAEAFEICEYGEQPGAEEIRRLFPMIGTKEIKISSTYTGGEGIWKIKHTKDFDITGDGSAANWNNAGWLTLPQRNSTNIAYQTQVKLLYSDSGIYCLYHCEDSKITATLKEDFLDLWNEDVVEAFFWTDEAVPMYFEYELSPLNYELPILVPNIKGNFLGWRPSHYEGSRRTKHATHINKNGDAVSSWTAEFYIPYSLLAPMTNVPPKKGEHWRANFYRIDYDKDKVTWQWQMVQNERFHDYERFGTIVFD